MLTGHEGSSASGRPLTQGTFGAALTLDEWAALESLGHAQTYPVRSTLMFQGEPGERIMVVLSGRVKVFLVSPDGHEHLLSIRDPGDVLGELSFLDFQPRAGSVVALEPVEVRTVPSSVFREFLERTPRVAVVLLEVLSRRFRETTEKRAQFGALDTLGRLSARLAELADRYGAPCEGGIGIQLSLTQEELRAWTGASAAGVAKALQTMRDLGWITTHRRRIVVTDIGALRSRSGSAPSGTMTLKDRTTRRARNICTRSDWYRAVALPPRFDCRIKPVGPLRNPPRAPRPDPPARSGADPLTRSLNVA